MSVRITDLFFPFFKCPRVHPCECGGIHEDSLFPILPAGFNLSSDGAKVDAWPHFLGVKEIDISAMGMIATPDRKKLVDLVYAIWTEAYVMVVPAPGEEPRLFAFILPFQSTVWLLILITMITMVAIMSSFSKIYLKFFAKVNTGHNNLHPITSREETSFRWIIHYAVYIINTMTNQGGGIAIARLSFRILVGAWLLIAMVLVNSYSGTVISYLTVPKMKKPINNLEDLSRSEDVGLILLADTVIEQQIKDAETGALKVLGDQVRSNPDRIASSVPKLYSRLESGNFAFPFLKTFCQNFVLYDFKKDGKCRFKFTDPINIFGLWSLPMQKDSKYSPMFTIAYVLCFIDWLTPAAQQRLNLFHFHFEMDGMLRLMELWEAGIPPFSVKKALTGAEKCFAKTKPRASSREVPIRLADLMGAFFILGIGLSLALFAFLVEIIFNYRDLRSRRKKTTVQKQNSQ